MNDNQPASIARCIEQAPGRVGYDRPRLAATHRAACCLGAAARRVADERFSSLENNLLIVPASGAARLGVSMLP